MKIQTKYGDEPIIIEVNSEVKSIGLPAADEDSIECDDNIRGKIEIGLEDFAISAADKVAVVLNDGSRESGSDRILFPLIDRLRSRGIKLKNISVIVAYGAHKSEPEDDLRSFLGDFSGEIHIIHHDCTDADSLIKIGTTSRGTPILINKIIIESDRVICIGSASFHYFAGFGGGIKSLIPGVAGYETILANHRLSITGKGSGLHPLCKERMINVGK